jgi:hypothetical protein
MILQPKLTAEQTIQQDINNQTQGRIWSGELSKPDSRNQQDIMLQFLNLKGSNFRQYKRFQQLHQQHKFSL